MRVSFQQMNCLFRPSASVQRIGFDLCIEEMHCWFVVDAWLTRKTLLHRISNEFLRNINPVVWTRTDCMNKQFREISQELPSLCSDNSLTLIEKVRVSRRSFAKQQLSHTRIFRAVGGPMSPVCLKLALEFIRVLPHQYYFMQTFHRPQISVYRCLQSSAFCVLKIATGLKWNFVKWKSINQLVTFIIVPMSKSPPLVRNLKKIEIAPTQFPPISH